MQTKFYYKSSTRCSLDVSFPCGRDYLATYKALHASGIYANVKIIEYNFDQPFDDMDEAVEFWKEYLGIVTSEFDDKLRSFLEHRPCTKKERFKSTFQKRSAIIWWSRKRTG